MQIRAPRTKEDAEAILALLRGMHEEVGRAPLDERKAFIAISHVVQADAARVIEKDGEMIASYGLVKTPWWFSGEEAYFSMWFYVAPAHRSGWATKMLLEDIADRAEDEGVAAYLHVYEPRKPGGSIVRRIGEEIGFAPSGRLVAIEPGRAE